MKPMTWRLALLLLAAVGAAGAVGCQQTAWILVQIVKPWTPEEEIEAQYSLGDKSILVLVDTKDMELASQWPHLNQAVAESVTKVLVDHKACGPTVPPRSVETVRRTEPDFANWSVAQAGKHFNVDLVVHVEMLQFRLRDNVGSNVYHGYAQAAVRIVDTDTGRQVWPVLSSARLVEAETQPGVEAEGPSEQQEIILNGFGDKVARTFFTYKREELSIRPKVK
jgi:hypothetical protein